MHEFFSSHTQRALVFFVPLVTGFNKVSWSRVLASPGFPSHPPAVGRVSAEAIGSLVVSTKHGRSAESASIRNIESINGSGGVGVRQAMGPRRHQSRGDTR